MVECCGDSDKGWGKAQRVKHGLEFERQKDTEGQSQPPACPLPTRLQKWPRPKSLPHGWSGPMTLAVRRHIIRRLQSEAGTGIQTQDPPLEM